MLNKADQSRIRISLLKKGKPADKDTEAPSDHSPRNSPKLSPRHTVIKRYKFKPNAADANPVSSTSEPNTEPRLRAVNPPTSSRTDPDPHSILQEVFADYGAQPSFFELMTSDDAPALELSPPKDWVFTGKAELLSSPTKKRMAAESSESPLKKKRKLEQARAHSVAADHMIRRHKDPDLSPLSSPRMSEKNSSTASSTTSNSTQVNSTTVAKAGTGTNMKSSTPPIQ